MKKKISDLAVLGGEPLFKDILPVGQINIPSFERFKSITEGIFARQYYTNHGILAQGFEEKLCELFQTKHAITMTNATIGISLAAKAMGLKGNVIVPAFTFAATAQALSWAGINPIFCDVDSKSHVITAEIVEPLLKKYEISAILGVHLWGNPCDVDSLAKIAQKYGVKIFYDAAHAVGCTYRGRPVGNFGECEIFSFHATKVLNTTEGGCITTNDDDLAESLRNLRSSYGRHKNVTIPVNANGRFSEFQAAFGLLSLEDFPRNCSMNKHRLEAYHKHLGQMPGIRFTPFPPAQEKHNYQYVVMEVDKDNFGLDRDQLVQLLMKENIYARKYFIPGMHKSIPYSLSPQPELPITDALCQKVMQLPSGSAIGDEEIEKICDLIQFAHDNASEIADRL